MFPLGDFRETIRAISEILKQLEVRFHLTGGATSILYGEPRMTQDIDLVVDALRLQSRITEFFAELAQRHFLFDKPAVNESLRTGRLFQLFDTASSLKLDLYPRELVAGELDRSVLVELLPGLNLPAVSRLDAALSKLIWIQRGSHKSRRDLRQIVRRAPAAEVTDLEEQAADLGLTKLLRDVLSESDEISE